MTFSPEEPTGGVASAAAVGGPTAATPPIRTPAPAERLLERADGLAAGARPADAVAVYRELLAAEPGHVDARLHLARLLVQLEEHEQALVLLADTLRNAPDQTEFLVLRGGIFTHLRRYEEADGDLRRVLRLYPSHAPAHLELGRLLWRKGLAGEAAIYFRRALEFQPESARICASLGDALNQAGDLPGAQAALQRALELDPRDSKTHHLMGRVFDRLGRPDEARDMYERSRELAGG
jgi:tetratricopeptide (TPR) repeat protein